MCLSLAIPTFAKDENNSIDTIYVGEVCVQVDSSLSQAERVRLIELMENTEFIPEGIVCGVEQSYGFENNTESESNSRTLSDDKFYIEIVSQKLSESGYDAFKLSAIALWINSPDEPIFVFDDVLAITWSGDFSLYADSARTFYKDKNGTSVELYNQAERIKVDASKGLAYSVPMRVTGSPTYYYYYMQVDAYIHKKDSSGTANAVAQYAHKSLGLDISIDFDSTSNIFSGIGVISDTSKAVYCDLIY